ncbi:MAG: hypothetical protein ABIE03_02525 [Patescibacteria group bacterium]|nr:hypothetical protein [Patescibacteria group bacterium]
MTQKINDPGETARIFAIISLVLACISLIGGFFVGLYVLPIMLISVVLAIMGLKSGSAKVLSILALSINGLFLLIGTCAILCLNIFINW